MADKYKRLWGLGASRIFGSINTDEQGRKHYVMATDPIELPKYDGSQLRNWATMDELANIPLISQPRRYGKTTAMKMMDDYLKQGLIYHSPESAWTRPITNTEGNYLSPEEFNDILKKDQEDILNTFALPSDYLGDRKIRFSEPYTSKSDRSTAMAWAMVGEAIKKNPLTPDESFNVTTRDMKHWTATELKNMHGWNYRCVMDGVPVSGKISIYEEMPYLCQNFVKKHNTIPEIFGYKWAWATSAENLNKGISDGIADLEVWKEYSMLDLLKDKFSSASQGLPEKWAVKHDGTEKSRNAIIDYAISKGDPQNWRKFGICMGTHYYGFKEGRGERGFFNTSILEDETILTIQEFIQLTSKTIKQEKNGKEQKTNSDRELNLPVKIAAVTVGKRCRGNSVSGNRGFATISRGYSEHSAINSYSEEVREHSSFDIPF